MRLQAKEISIALEVLKEGAKFMEPNLEDVPMDEEACSNEISTLSEDVELELSQAEKELSQLISINLKPIQKEFIKRE